MITGSDLYQIHISALQKTCIVLSVVSEDILSDQTLSRSLYNIASRLPGPLTEENNEGNWSIEQALPLISSTQASITFLSKSGQFSNLGERVADTLRDTLSELELALGQKLRLQFRPKLRGLYVIIDPLVTNGRDPLQIAQWCLDGGASVVQLRDKSTDKGESHSLAHNLKLMCDDKSALFIVNDHADLAATVEADGVHVGQTDLSVYAARSVLSPQQIVGRSNHTLQEVLETDRQGADYIAVGAMYPTRAKDQPIVGGTKLLRQVKEVTTTPVVAIGGITEDRVREVTLAGADAICVITAVGLSENPFESCYRMVNTINKTRGEI